MEVKEDHMLSPAGDSEPTLRTAHILNPIANSILELTLNDFNLNPFSSSAFEPKDWPLTVHFDGWSYKQEKWVCWVDKLQQKYESVWKKAGIFDAIMSTKCYIHKNHNLLFGVVEKWCCETNTFLFPFGEATITLEDVMVLGGYPVLGDPVFTPVKDQEMREVEKKLILARQEPWKRKKGKPRPSTWMDICFNNGSEVEHETFLVTWLSTFVFPSNLVKSYLFPIAIHLARGNPIALAPAVLGSLYKDLTLFKKTIVDLSKHPVGGDRYPLELTLQSPFYLVQIWVWERFKNLQPQPQTMLINYGNPFLFRWHKVKALKLDNVKLALDSAVDDFLWRPYVRYADNCGMFYPNDEICVPFNEDLDKKVLSFVTCLRVSELVGFDSIEQYLPHRVAMQFGMDQDVPRYVPRFNETKSVAWENYCRPVSDKNLYFPPRLFEADVTMRYVRWWKQSVLCCDNFVKNAVRKKRSASSRKHRPCVRIANNSDKDVGVPPRFPASLGKNCDVGSKCKTRKIDDLYTDVPYEISVHNCLKVVEIIDANARKAAKVKSSKTQGKNQSYAIRESNTVVQHDLQHHSDMAAQAEARETVEEREVEATALLKEELARVARQQEEILRLMDLREKRDEELRQLLTSVLRNQQQPPPSSS